MPPRLRLIAGPNGSGKTTLTNTIREKLSGRFGIYVNADDMQRLLKERQTLDFGEYSIQTTKEEFATFYKQHPLAPQAVLHWDLLDTLFIALEPLPELTYFPTLLADFIREQLLKQGVSFVFETVMSDAGKVALLQRAQAAGYRTYLYFVCIEDPMVNIDRVADRVRNAGHHVPKEKILDRYNRSLQNAVKAIPFTNRAYFWDNSGTSHELIAEITDAEEIELQSETVPSWFEERILNQL